MDLQVDQWNDTTRLLVTRRLEIIEAVVCKDEPTPSPALMLPPLIKSTVITA